jgi:DNA ligase-1
MTLYQIIQQLHNANGTIEKQAIFDANKGNALLKEYVRVTLDPGINYYQKKIPKAIREGWEEFSAGTILELYEKLANRRVTGDLAKEYLQAVYSDADAEARELISYMIDRKIGKTSVGETMALKTWPGLFFTVPYQRCSLLDKKARERFGKLKRFYVQTKADGSFAYIVKRKDHTVDVITRQGSKYPQWFAEMLTNGMEPGTVVVGELLVGEAFEGPEDVMLDRKTANGILNSCLKDGDGLGTHRTVHVQAWDMLTQDEFEAGKSSRNYEDRLKTMQSCPYFSMTLRIQIIYTAVVSSLEEAFAIYQEHLQRGLEGVIISDPDDLWKDGTSKGKVKLKIKFEVEMRVKRLYEGEGKAAGMLGGVELESEDGGIENDCGSGFDDKQRKLFWDQPHMLLNMVVMVEANDITTTRDGKKKPALSLPIFCEVRYDKVVADTTERIYAQLEAAKQGG